MSELSPEARALFRAARRAPELPDAAHDHVRAAIEMRLALDAIGAGAAKTWLTAATVAKTTVAIIVLAGAGWTVSSSHRASTAHAPPSARAQTQMIPLATRTAPVARETVTAPVAPAPPTVIAPAAGATEGARRPPHTAHLRDVAPSPARAVAPSPAVSVSAPTTVAAPSPVDPAPSLADEVRLVAAARASLRAGDGVAALRELDAHAQRFPHGALEVEATAMRILALCAADRRDEARALARRWLPLAARSPTAASVRRSCAVDAP